jgi:polar amino acid transport system permease protein
MVLPDINTAAKSPDIHARVAPRVLSGATALAAAIVVGAGIYVVISSGTVHWAVIGQYLFAPEMLQGVLTTLWLTFLALAGAIVIGTLLAAMRISTNVVFRGIATAYIWFFRGTPLLVQLVFWFNFGLFLPHLGIGSWSVATNSVITSTTAALLGLVLNVSAFMCEVIRGGLLSVDKGQTEAALSLGMMPSTALMKIVLPQSIRIIVPAAGNLAIDLLKATSLVYVIGTKEILGTVESIAAQNFYVIELLMVASIWYLALVSVASFAQSRLERWLSRSTAATKAVKRKDTFNPDTSVVI